ncbi:MAG: ATP-binding protein [Caulobacter sp.]|nr:ATP-binding protein [Caulobacter sp.]
MAPTAPSDAARVAEIRSLDLNALKPVIDRVTRLARRASGAPYAYVLLVEEDHVWQCGLDDLPYSTAPMAESTTARHLNDEEPFWLEDARADAPDHAWVTGWPFVRGYAVAPIILSNGVRLGGLCIINNEPWARDEVVVATLVDLAALLGDAIERLRAQRQAEVAERKARAATSLKDAVMHASPVSLSMTDRDLRYLYVNDQWVREKAVAEADALGRTMGEVFPASFAGFRAAYDQCLAGEMVTADQVRAPRSDGSDRWLRVAIGPWRDGEGQIGGLISMSHDITDVIESLQRAKRSEKRLKLALEIAEVLVYEVDYTTRTLTYDGAADTFFGGAMTFDDVARDMWVTVHPDDRDAAVACWEQHLKDGRPFRTDYRMNTPDGREVWAFSAAELILGDDGQVNGVLGVLKNITGRKQVEAATERARQMAEAANRAKSEFLANMSHEIRTPLNGVMGVTAALARTELNTAQSEMVGLIETSGQTLEALLADILDLARIESGRLELKPEPFDFVACLKSAAALFQPGAVDKGLDFQLAIDPAIGDAYLGDAVRLRQVISNLLSNAVKFTTTGHIRLEAGVDGEGGLFVVVSDTGIGFSADVKARLFQRFEQADGSITRRFGGTGLGLAISRALAEAMGGVLQAESTPGSGSRFTLTVNLPGALEPLAQKATPILPALDESRPPRVLLAEDHPINRKVVELLFAGTGVELSSVENGAEAVQAAREGCFDLILMDMQMPVMDGLTAIAAIRAIEAAGSRRSTPIWALSANALPEHVAASMAVGADGHLSKPVSADALFGALEAACAQRPDEAIAISAQGA